MRPLGWPLMGLYDTLHVGDRSEQVKLWSKALSWFHLGDHVGPPQGGLAPDGDYSVAMWTGGYVHVRGGTLVGWHDEPGPHPVVDTRGEAVAVPRDDVVRLTTKEERRLAALMAHDAEPCPSCGQPPLHPVHLDSTEASRAEAAATAEREVAAFLAREPDTTSRIAAARAALADRRGYAHVKVGTAARLLGLDVDPDMGGELLLELLRRTARGATELQALAFLVEVEAARLPIDALVQALRLLTAFLPTPEEESAQQEQEPEWQRDEVSHPRLRRRRAVVALSAPEGEEEHRRSFLSWLDQLGRTHVESAARAAVAHRGAAAVPGVACRFWGWDVIATRLIVQVLQDRLSRPLTHQEQDVARWALDDETGYLDDLPAAQVEAALARAVARAAS